MGRNRGSRLLQTHPIAALIERREPRIGNPQMPAARPVIGPAHARHIMPNLSAPILRGRRTACAPREIGARHLKVQDTTPPGINRVFDVMPQRLNLIWARRIVWHPLRHPLTAVTGPLIQNRQRLLNSVCAALICA